MTDTTFTNTTFTDGFGNAVRVTRRAENDFAATVIWNGIDKNTRAFDSLVDATGFAMRYLDTSAKVGA